MSESTDSPTGDLRDSVPLRAGLMRRGCRGILFGFVDNTGDFVCYRGYRVPDAAIRVSRHNFERSLGCGLDILLSSETTDGLEGVWWSGIPCDYDIRFVEALLVRTFDESYVSGGEGI